ncbi:aa3-type cytochrome c oxidase subunit IV [Roseomonas sp. OT10]|uniref:aa3-type cytochrome c oxidase subunit IV n=1 Tax=Roseomonas cutis TaxID=2897332 RepID=UPI001E572675|nr:aa3-type cytochrome c oxidase subunit IV [Roseomonas sp. OT10]UFN47531.1 aa3-type cytochrome c oxidase subunit IV [Roseomonas sp. OT10]
MAEVQTSYEMVPVAAKDILADRQHGWDTFMRATQWGIGAVVVLLVLIYLFFG